MEIAHIQAFPLDVPLLAPFVVATTRLDQVRNVAIRVTLSDGSVGWGEAPTLPPITTETQDDVFAAFDAVATGLSGCEIGEWQEIAARLAEQIPDAASTRAGIEMALVDALARSRHMPVFTFFGGVQTHVVTDITIPICESAEAERLATAYGARGFRTIKTKVGHDVDEDLERLRAIRRGHPNCVLVLDANEGYTAEEALAVLNALRREDMVPGLFEQPVAREDWDGLGTVTREGGVPVAADESCRGVDDARRIAREGLAHVVNIKLVKCGVAECLEIAAVARENGIGLMVGVMVETRLATGFSAHFAAGLGGFQWIDLDAPLLLAGDPVRGGYTADGPRYELGHIRAGHGADLDTAES